MSDSINAAERSALFKAIRNGDHAQVKNLIQQKPELLLAFDPDSFGATPLTTCAFCGDSAMLDTLLDIGADPDRHSDWNMGPWSPLHCAIHSGFDEMAEHLLSRGATLDAHTAAALGKVVELEQMLTESAQRVHERGGDGCLPLHFAGTEQAVDLLLDHGANIDARCIDHFSTAAQYRCQPKPEIARYLFAKGATADIFSASMAGDEAVVQQLIAENPNVVHERLNQQRFPPGPEHDVHNIMTFVIGSDTTALHAAARGNQPAVIQKLVQAGLNPDVTGGYDDATALHLAAWNDLPDSAAALIQCGADVNHRSGSMHNNTPAGWAIVAGSADVFQLLMNSGAKRLEWFNKDAQAGADGDFHSYKVVPQQQRDAILKFLQESEA